MSFDRGHILEAMPAKHKNVLDSIVGSSIFMFVATNCCRAGQERYRGGDDVTGLLFRLLRAFRYP